MHPNEEPRVPFISQRLAGAEGPFVATSDWDTLVPDQIRPWIPGKYLPLGAPGFGISDTRRAARRYFHVDAESTVVRVLQGLVEEGKMDKSVLQEAIDRYQLFNNAIDAAPMPPVN